MESSITNYINMDLRREMYGEDACYIDPVVIKMSVVHDLKFMMTYDDLKKFIKEATVKLKDSDIKKYLTDKMDKEHPGLRKRLNDERNYSINDKSHIEKVNDQKIAAAYYYDPYSLNYFKKYILILKQKLIELCNLIDDLNQLENEEAYNRVKKKLHQLDMRINYKNELYYIDAIRIEEAFVYNFNDFYKKVVIANNLETYYKFKLTKAKVLKECVFESNLYPKKELQIKDLKYLHDKQFISLSAEQEKKLIEEEKKDWSSDETMNEIDYNHVLRRTK